MRAHHSVFSLDQISLDANSSCYVCFVGFWSVCCLLMFNLSFRILLSAILNVLLSKVSVFIFRMLLELRSASLTVGQLPGFQWQFLPVQPETVASMSIQSIPLSLIYT